MTIPRPSDRILKFFRFEHLPEGALRWTSEQCARLAEKLADDLPESAEKTAGLRKLLEAKDCFVRAALEGAEATPDPDAK